jgi:hypothetical protein
MKGKKHFGDLDVDERITLKGIPKTPWEGMDMFFWLRIRTSVDCCQQDNENWS